MGKKIYKIQTNSKLNFCSNLHIKQEHRLGDNRYQITLSIINDITEKEKINSTESLTQLDDIKHFRNLKYTKK